MKENEPQGESQECGKTGKEKDGICDSHPKSREDQLDESRDDYGDREAEEPSWKKRSQNVYRRSAGASSERRDGQQKQDGSFHKSTVVFLGGSHGFVAPG
jgi:hypothetical protein